MNFKNRNRTSVAVVVVAGLLLLEVSAASAQLARPSRESANGIFGQPRGNRVDVPVLDVFGSVYGGYDGDVLAGLTGVTGSGPTTGRRASSRAGGLAGGSASLFYRNPGERWEIDLSGLGSVTHSPEFSGAMTTGSAARANLNGRLTGSTQLQLAGMLEYSPRYGVATTLFEQSDNTGVPLLSDGIDDLDPASLQAWQEYARVGVTQALTRRSSLNASYTFRDVDFDTFPRDMRLHSGRLAYQYDVTQGVSLELGYGYTESTHEQATRLPLAYRAHQIIAGVNHERSLSLTRHTTFSYGVGSAISQRERDTDSRFANDTSNQFHVTGDARLQHEIGRTWTSSVSYSRGLRFLNGFSEPVIADTVVASVGGFTTRRMDVSAFARYGIGSSSSTGQRAFDSASTSAQIRYGFNRHTSVFAQYFFNWYESRRPDDPFFATLGDLSRHGIRIGVNLWGALLN